MKIVIVGGGFGGLACAKALGNSSHDVLVIDKKNYNLFQPLLYQVATGALSPADIAELQSDGTITGGMIPKLETCVHAVEAGCEAAVVLDGRVPHAMLLEFFTARGAGTLIRAEQSPRSVLDR